MRDVDNKGHVCFETVHCMRPPHPINHAGMYRLCSVCALSLSDTQCVTVVLVNNKKAQGCRHNLWSKGLWSQEPEATPVAAANTTASLMALGSASSLSRPPASNNCSSTAGTQCHGL